MKYAKLPRKISLDNRKLSVKHCFARRCASVKNEFTVSVCEFRNETRIVQNDEYEIGGSERTSRRSAVHADAQFVERTLSQCVQF